MGYVDLQRRREERARGRRKPGGSRRQVVRDPLFLLGAGFVLGSVATLFYSDMPYMGGFSTLIPFVTTVALLCYFAWLLPGKPPENTGPKPGSEKQLLMAIQAAGGITPVEAALETSLAVDEAEEILTRLAGRGHLVVEGRDGALLYTLPGGHPGGRTAPGT